MFGRKFVWKNAKNGATIICRAVVSSHNILWTAHYKKMEDEL